MMDHSQFVFNLVINACCSFIAGVMIVHACIRLFNVDESRWKFFLLSLPFFKIIWDLLCRGIPTSSVVHAGFNPLNLPPNHQTLTLGAGLTKFGPVLNLVFSTKGLDGKSYSASFADYVFAWFGQHFGSIVPRAILAVILFMSCLLILRRLVRITQFERERRKYRITDRFLQTIPCWPRSIEVYSSDKYHGTPFTGGILRPYICLPHQSMLALDDEERRAVVLHEVAHIRHWDLLATVFIKSLGDFFWFVPGYHVLSTKIDRLREILADQAAVKAGASALHLASALLRLQSRSDDRIHDALHSAFFREKSLLKIRVERLVGETSSSSKPRWGWSNRLVRVVITAWTAGAVMIATLGGNHEVNVQEFPLWLESLLRKLGL